jgi:hypothetical protein
LNLLIMFGWGRHWNDDLWLAKGGRCRGATLRQTYVGETDSGYEGGTLEKKAACKRHNQSPWIQLRMKISEAWLPL